MKVLTRDDALIYLCEVCGLGYRDKETAARCEAFCTEHNACSLEITKNAIFKPDS